MNTVRLLGQMVLASAVILGSATVNLDPADAQSCSQVLGPKRAWIPSSNCSPDAQFPSNSEVQASPIGQKQDPLNADQLTPGQSDQNTGDIGGTLEEQTQPKVLIRGPKRGGYIDN